MTHHRSPFGLRVLAAFATAGLVFLAGAGSAAAHVEPDESQVPAGKPATVAFTVEHGCEESPTTKVEIKLPDGITDAAGVAKKGWTSKVAGGVLTYTGGPLDAHTAEPFSITFTPTTAGDALRFPIIQTCEQGEIDWIAESESDDHPAPVVKVGPADSDPVAGEHDEGGDGGSEAGSTTTAGPTATTVAPTTTATPGDGNTTPDEGSKTKDTKDSSTGPLIASGIAALVVVLGGGYALSRRTKRNP